MNSDILKRHTYIQMHKGHRIFSFGSKNNLILFHISHYILHHLLSYSSSSSSSCSSRYYYYFQLKSNAHNLSICCVRIIAAYIRLFKTKFNSVCENVPVCLCGITLSLRGRMNAVIWIEEHFKMLIFCYCWSQSVCDV